MPNPDIFSLNLPNKASLKSIIIENIFVLIESKIKIKA